MSLSKCNGIDLGTTNSAIGAMNATDSDITLYRDDMGVATTPSCVWYDAKDNRVVVGRRAYNRRGGIPEPITSIKRKMGSMLLTPLGKAKPLPKNLPHELVTIFNESAADRLERYLLRITDRDKDRQEAKRDDARKNPPTLWVYDHKARLADYLNSIQDAAERERVQQDPPLLWLPEEVSALILAELRNQMQETLRQAPETADWDVKRVLVTVPAYFGDNQMEATREAGTMAGLRVVELLQEPAAAAKYYCWKYGIRDGVFMILDLGGGTFDVSIIRQSGGRLSETLGISGNNLLGGDNMDAALAEWMRERIARSDPELKLDLDTKRAADKSILNGLKRVAEGAKIALTSHAETVVRDTNTVRDLTGASVAIEMVVKKGDFEGLITPIIAQCEPKCWEALARAAKRGNVSLKDVNYIFLVGGSTHVPAVGEFVKSRFCRCDKPEPTSQEVIEAMLEEINGDDPKETSELRAKVRMMLGANERAATEKPIRHEPELAVVFGAAIRAAEHGVVSEAIHFKGERGTSEAHTTIAGTVSPETMSGHDMEGAAVQVSSEALGYEDEADMGKDGTFSLSDVPLQPSADNHFRVAVLDARGDTLHEETITIRQDPKHKFLPPVDPPTLSKAYYMDVIDKGKLSRHVLLASGTVLPAQCPLDLRVPDPNTGMVDFRIYQARRPLKTVRALIDPTLSPGTAIDFRFAISEDRMMVVEYRIGDGPPDSAVVEPPEPDRPPTDEEVAAMNRRIDDNIAVASRSAAQRETLSMKRSRINDKLMKARKAADEPQMIDAFTDLQDLQRETSTVAPVLKPSWPEFVALLAECQQLTNKVEQHKPEYPVQEARQNLLQIAEAAKAAYDAGNQEEYRQRYDQVMSIGQALYAEVQDKIETPPPPPPEEAARNRVKKLQKQCEDLVHSAENLIGQFESRATGASDKEAAENRRLADGARSHKQRVWEGAEKLESLLGDCATDPQGVQSDCNTVEGVLDRSKTALDQLEKVLRGEAGIESVPWL